MSGPQVFPGWSSERSPQKRQELHSSTHLHPSVTTPLLPQRSGITMESARRYGADVEKRPLAGEQGWERTSYEQTTYVEVKEPRRRTLRWAAAGAVFGLSALAVFQSGMTYQSAKDVVHQATQEMLHVRQASGSTSSNSTNATFGTLAPRALKPLPLGSIKPMGWLQAEMQSMADGLAGHEMDYYPIVSDSVWLGGKTEYSPLNEGLPYWLNGLVPLAYGLGDDTLMSQVKNAVNQVIASQDPTTGFLGPVVYNDGRDLWSRYPLFLGLANLAAADSSMTDKVVGAMYKYLPHANDLLNDGALTAHEEDWARSRYADMILGLQWLFENHPTYNGTDQRGLLWSMMNTFKEVGIDWAGYYTKQSYFFQDLDTVPANTGDGSSYFPFLHGVNVGQGLKTMAVNYLFTHNASLLDTQRDAVDWTIQYHGAPSGTILADEREVGLSPNRGSELCTAVETMFSMHTIYSITGENAYADHAELAAFNALPVSMTPDHWAHQYIALPNQPWAAPIAGREIFWNVGDFGTTFGTAPNYPCCAVNHPQGWPKFSMASFMTSGDDGLAHVLLAPTVATTTLGNGANVKVVANTDYPFSDVLSYQITTDKPFTFYVRVPGWASSPSLTMNGNEVAVTTDSSSGLTPISIAAGSTNVQYVLQSTLKTVARANDTVAVYRGALLYALDVGMVNTSTPGSSDITRNLPPTSDQDVVAALTYYTNETLTPSSSPAGARDYNISNTKPWNYAIDETTLKFFAYNGSQSSDAIGHASTVMLQGESLSSDSAGNPPSLPNPIFAYEAPSSYVTAMACQVEWELFGNSPFRPPLKGDRACIGDPVEVVFRPYGSLKVHMSELPTVSLSNSTS